MERTVGRALAWVAGETSGDMLASHLIRALRTHRPESQHAGIGGPYMQAEGFEAWWPSNELAVRGYVEVLRHYRRIVGIRRQLRDRLLANPPQLFVGVDAPDFNLDLERDLKRAGIPTLHFICPSIWAWRPERIHKIRASVDHVLCVFPFEPEILHAAGIGASFVGHPLAQAIPARVDASAARVRLGLSPEGPVFALLPGSRESELHYHTKLFLRAAARIRDKRPGIRFVLPAVPEMHDQLAKAVSESELRGIVDVLRGQSHLALAACDAALVASGTATLETALFGKPMVIAYRMNPLSWWLMRSKRLQPWVGLPNILCQEFVVPEFLQEDATPEVLAGAMLQWLQDPAHAHAVQVRFRGLHQTLHRDTASLSVNAIESLLGA